MSTTPRCDDDGSSIPCKEGKDIAKLSKQPATQATESVPTVVGEERFQQIMSALDPHEKITDDKGQDIEFKGEIKKRLMEAYNKTQCLQTLSSTSL